jgi:ribosome-associated protein
VGHGHGEDLHPLRRWAHRSRLRAGWEGRRPIADELRIDGRLSIPLGEVELRASRSSGPGGQHANVTASRVEAVFDVEASRALDERQRAWLASRAGPVVTAVAQDARGQARNRELALRRLAEKIADGLATPALRRPTGPTRASRERRLEEKRRAGERKQRRRRPSGDW